MFKKMFLVTALFTTSFSYSIDYKAIPGDILGGLAGITGIYNGVSLVSRYFNDYPNFDYTPRAKRFGAYTGIPIVAASLNLYYANSQSAPWLGVKHIMGILTGLAACGFVMINGADGWYFGTDGSYEIAYRCKNVTLFTRLATAACGVGILCYANRCLLNK